MTEIIQWVWQGVALVVVVSLSLARARGVSASMRYRVWWATLALVVALPFLSAMDLPGLGAVLGVKLPVESPATSAALRSVLDVPSWLALLPLMACAAWIVWNAGRCYVAIAHLDMAKRACRPFPIVRERQLPRWKAARNRGRRAMLAVSEHVRAAGVLGLGYPRIAIAPDLVSALTDEELDQLVLHEYAHVQRRDDVVSAVQMVVRSVIGWHPAVWWIDRRLRIEREVACDDWVLAATGEPRTYARCLTRIAGLSVGSESALVPATGPHRQLTTRVLRLLDRERNTSVRTSGLALAGATFVLVLVSIGLAGSQSAAVALPAVAEVGLPTPAVPAVPEPGLSYARLLRTLYEPNDRRAGAIPPALETRVSLEHTSDAVQASVMVILPDFTNVSDTAEASPDLVLPSSSPAPREAHAAPVAPVGRAADSRSRADDNMIDPLPLNATPVIALNESGSWVGASSRAVVDAGRIAGQSIASASVDAGLAVADASIVAFKSGQKSAVKAGKFFSRLGRTLSRPF
jgi:beta-lactamase regulating signal transducer with metallopeptidase domain